MEKIHRVFAYGTLKTGQYFNKEYLSDAEYKGMAIASTDYSLYVGAQPHLIREQSDTGVKGELYDVDENNLQRLDELAAHPVVYRREIIEVVDENGERVLAWSYLRHPRFRDKEQCFKEFEFI